MLLPVLLFGIIHIVNQIRENQMKDKLYVYIGRFQIPHFGHESVMSHAIENGDEVLILIGSANSERSKKNPFSFSERKEMVEKITDRLKVEKRKEISVSIISLNDFDTDAAWVEAVKNSVPDNKQVYITGCKKSGDESTFYLDLFPEWKEDFITEVNVEGIDVISSTKIRDLFFSEKEIPEVISETTKDFLKNFRNDNYKNFSELKAS